MKECANCFNKFFVKRNTAKYCSDACKMEYYRNGGSRAYAQLKEAAALIQAATRLLAISSGVDGRTKKAISEIETRLKNLHYEVSIVGFQTALPLDSVSSPVTVIEVAPVRLPIPNENSPQSDIVGRVVSTKAGLGYVYEAKYDAANHRSLAIVRYHDNKKVTNWTLFKNVKFSVDDYGYISRYADGKLELR